VLVRILALVVVLALLAGTFFFGHGESTRDQPVATATSAGDTGYSARDAEIIETGVDGKPRYRLEADRITQQPHDGMVNLEHVTMHYRTELGEEWRLRADHGELPEDARNVRLDGAVLVDGPLSSKSQATAERTMPELELTTEHLNIDTLEQVVTTADPVTVLWSGERIDGTGLWANLKDQRLRLESHVHGLFQPH
jgi:LPS export ABC transporter protein LptC